MTRYFLGLIETGHGAAGGGGGVGFKVGIGCVGLNFGRCFRVKMREHLISSTGWEKSWSWWVGGGGASIVTSGRCKGDAFLTNRYTLSDRAQNMYQFN